MIVMTKIEDASGAMPAIMTAMKDDSDDEDSDVMPTIMTALLKYDSDDEDEVFCANA